MLQVSAAWRMLKFLKLGPNAYRRGSSQVAPVTQTGARSRTSSVSHIAAVLGRFLTDSSSEADWKKAAPTVLETLLPPLRPPAIDRPIAKKDYPVACATSSLLRPVINETPLFGVKLWN